MLEEFIKDFSQFKFLGINDLYKLYSLATFKKYGKGELLAIEGNICNYTYFVRSGLLRNYVLTEDAEEKTVKLTKEKDLTGSESSFLERKPSTEYIDALEDTKVIAFDTIQFQDLANKNPKFQKLELILIKKAFKDAVKRVEFFTLYSPEKRYETILKEHPDLINRVPQKILASFLGVTPVSLSRIRSRLSSK